MRETRLDGRLFGFFLFFISFLLKSAEMPHFRAAFLLGIFFVNAIWYARLDLNQRPLESEFSGRQRRSR